MSLIYRYLHLDSSHRNPHEKTSQMQVHLNSHTIKNCNRVGVMKASITNTGHNVHSNHDQLTFAIYIKGSPVVFINITLDHKYYTILEIVNEINRKISLFTDASSATLQSAVRNLVFTVENNKIEISVSTVAGAVVFYTPIVDSIGNPNTLWYDLGFSEVTQVIPGITYEQTILPTLVQSLTPETSVFVKQNNQSQQATITSKASYTAIKLKGERVVKIENTKGFYLASRSLTSGGNVFKSKVNSDGIAQVDYNDNLLFIPNVANRDEYNHFEVNMVEWHELHGDIQNFDIELRNHQNQVFSVDNITDSSHGSAIPPYTVTLIFECVNDNPYQPTHTPSYQAESWFEAHRQS